MCLDPDRITDTWTLKPGLDFQSQTREKIKPGPEQTGKNQTQTGSNYPDQKRKTQTGPDQRSSDRAIERSSDRAIERPSDRAIERPSDRATERPSDRATQQPIDRATDRPSDRATERPKMIIARAPDVHLRR